MPPMRPLGAAMLAAACCFVLALPAQALTGNGRLQIIHLDVGQGDGTLLITPNGQTALFDEGPGGTPAMGVTVVNQLKALGVTHLDHHFTSHYHSDHIGNFTSVLNGGIALDYGWDRAQSYTTATYTNYVGALGARRRTMVKNQVITLDSLSAHPVYLKCVDLAGAGVSTSDENSLSLVVKVSYGEYDEVIGGDLTGSTGGGGADVESIIGPEVGQVEVYKVHHHGSRYSSNTTWLNAIHPKIGVIECGNGNSYGHPTAEALSRLHAASVRTYWTETGAGVAPDPAWDKVALGQIRISATWTPGGVDSISGNGFADAFTNSGTSGDLVPPVVALSSPAGGENWNVGDLHAITWSATDNVGVSEIDLTYSTDGGATFPNVIASDVPNTGTYAWTVPSVLTGAARVRVIARDASGNVAADSSHTSFTTSGWTILASAGANGSISPSGTTIVGDGATPAYVSTPSVGFHLDDLLVNGVSVGAQGNFTFPAVHANQTIAASFAANPVDTQAPVVAVTSPAGGESWGVGSAHAITWTATDNTAVTGVDLAYSTDGGATFANSIATGLSNTGTYNWTVPLVLTSNAKVRVRARDAATNVGADSSHTAVAFTGWTVTANAGANGSITPAGAIVVADGATPSFTITPAPTYQVTSVLINSTNIGSVTNFTFPAVHSNQSITASFAIAAYALNVTTTGSGSVAKSPDQPTYGGGAVVQLTPTPLAGWSFVGWSGDATGSANPLTVTMNANKNITAIFGQHVYTWAGGASAPWTTAASWSPARATPATDDVLIFNSGSAVSASSMPTQSIGQLQITNNTSVQLAPTVASTLTINGGVGTDLSIASGSSLLLNTGVATSVALPSGATAAIAGNVTAGSAAHRLTAVDAGSVQFQSGSVATAGTGFSGNLFGTTGLNSIAFQNGSLYVQQAGANPFGAAAPNSVVQFQAGSRFRIDGAILPSLSGRTYADFEYNETGTQSGTGGSGLTLDSLIVSQGVFNVNLLGGATIKGSINVKSGAALGFTPAGAANYTLTGAASQNVNMAGTFTSNTNANVIVSNANGVTLTRDLSVAGTLTLANGRVNTGGNTLVLPAGATLTGASANRYVIGNLKRNIALGSSTVTFDVGDVAAYTPATLATSNAGGGAAAYDLTGTVRTGLPSHLGELAAPVSDQVVTRYFTFTPSALPAAGMTYASTLKFQASEVPSLPAGPLLTYSYDTAWQLPAAPVAQTSTSVQAANLSTYGDLVVAYSQVFTVAVTNDVPSGGSIAPSAGNVSVPYAHNQAFTFQPVSGYRIGDVKVDGVSIGHPAGYSFTNVTANHSLEVLFVPDAWVLDVGIAGAGAVTRNPDLSGYATGALVQLTATPEAGFAFLDWGGDSTAFANPLTINMQSDRTLIAKFIDIAPPIVHVTAPHGGESWPQGSLQNITWSASDNVGVDSVTVQYSLHGAAGPWVTIAQAVPSTGAQAWTVPSTSSDSALVRVRAYDHAFNSALAVSDSLFRIPANNVAVGPQGPAVLMLARPQPNPSAGVATLRFSLPQDGPATLEILDVEGRRVAVHDGRFTAGPHSWEWDGRLQGGSSPSGLFFARLTTPWGKRTERILRVR